MDVPAEVTAWLREHARTFDTTDPGTSLDDIDWLRGVVGDARVVGLGEATHGTREFFTMKHRLVEYLVTRMGFDLFAIEASMPHAEAIDAYVRGAEGDAADLLAGLGFWTWHTEEVRDLVEWLRARNRLDGAAPVGFEGFDLQSPTGSCHHVLGYLDTVDPAAAERARAAYAPFLARALPAGLTRETMPGFRAADASPGHGYAAAPRRVQESCRRGLQAVHDDLMAARQRHAAAPSREALDRAAHHAQLALLGEELLRDSAALWEAMVGSRLRRSIRVAELVARTATGRSYGAKRDRAMADNLRWLLDQLGPTSKIVLWAHNLHLADRTNQMGSHLRRRLGDDYRAVGFSFSTGWFNAVAVSDGAVGGLASHRADAAEPGSWEAALDTAGLPRLALDTRALPPDTDPVGSWLRRARRQRNIGATTDPRHPGHPSSHIRLPGAYDLLIHLHRTSAARSLPLPGRAADR